MLVVQNAIRPAAIRHAVADLIQPDLQCVQIASAYVTSEGVAIMVSALSRRVEPVRFARSPKTLIASLDFGLTDPAALSAWLALPNSQVRVAGADRVRRGSLRPRIAFHPKLYLFGYGQARTAALIGSANLTGRGYSVNTEAAWSEPTLSRQEANEAFADVSEGTEALTPDLLRLYRDLRQAQPPPPGVAREIERVSHPRPVRADELPMFAEAVDANEVDPLAYSQFWVQAEALQGGSRNQLELPRAANRFFGFDFAQYAARQAVRIGDLRLVGGARDWAERPLAWHGNNQMERLNLPTLNQGGFVYENSAVLFRRLPRGTFELVVADWESDLARAWRSASSEAGTLYRVGRRTARIAGLIE
jgi:HKD family nuclease